jgi:endonuclease/exonuclease/phosphatase (EEP) superfamily protein YafD
MRRLVDGFNVAVTALVLVAAAGALLALAGGRAPPLDTFSHLAPAYAALGAIGLLWALVAGRGPVAGAAMLAMIAGGLLVVPEFTRDAGPVAPPGAPDTIKVIQVNALRRNADIGRVVDWIVAQHADVVTVNEARHDLRDLLIRRTGWQTAGAHGNLIIFTPQPYVRMDRPRRTPDWTLSFVNATYAGSMGPMELVTAHIGWPTSTRPAAQARDLARVVAELPRERMILTGDLNATPWSAQLRRLDNDLGLTRRDRAIPTWPAQLFGQPWPLPFLPIDHLYAGPGWATVKVERGPWIGSDHYPLIVTLAPR